MMPIIAKLLTTPEGYLLSVFSCLPKQDPWALGVSALLPLKQLYYGTVWPLALDIERLHVGGKTNSYLSSFDVAVTLDVEWILTIHSPLLKMHSKMMLFEIEQCTCCEA